jgi:hypothetical protein
MCACTGVGFIFKPVILLLPLHAADCSHAHAWRIQFSRKANLVHAIRCQLRPISNYPSYAVIDAVTVGLLLADLKYTHNGLCYGIQLDTAEYYI